jgi:hypothetical protein
MCSLSAESKITSHLALGANQRHFLEAPIDLPQFSVGTTTLSFLGRLSAFFRIAVK